MMAMIVVAFRRFREDAPVLRQISADLTVSRDSAIAELKPPTLRHRCTQGHMPSSSWRHGGINHLSLRPFRLAGVGMLRLRGEEAYDVADQASLGLTGKVTIEAPASASGFPSASAPEDASVAEAPSALASPRPWTRHPLSLGLGPRVLFGLGP